MIGRTNAGGGISKTEFDEVITQKNEEIQNAKNTCNASNLRALGFRNIPSGNWKIVFSNWNISKRSDRIPLTIDQYGESKIEAYWGVKSKYLTINGKNSLWVSGYMDCTEMHRKGFGKGEAYALFLPYFYNGDLTAVQRNVTRGMCRSYLQKI